MSFSRSRRAYTLLEVLVVLGIIALLAAILIPVFARVRENGRKTVCLSNMRQIMTAVSLYTQDSAGQLPPSAELFAAEALYSSPQAISWTDALLPYLSTPQLLHCPSDELWTQREKPSLVVGWQPTPSSYIANTRCLTRAFATYPPPGRMVPVTHPAFERDFVRPSTTVWMCDGAQDAWGEAPYTQDYPDNLSLGQFERADTLGDPTGMPIANLCSNSSNPRPCQSVFAPNDRHLGRANVAFADGHVKAMLNTDWYFPGTPWLDPKRGG